VRRVIVEKIKQKLAATSILGQKIDGKNVKITNEDKFRSVISFGQKTELFLLNSFKQDVLSGHGVAMIDFDNTSIPEVSLEFVLKNRPQDLIYIGKNKDLQKRTLGAKNLPTTVFFRKVIDNNKILIVDLDNDCVSFAFKKLALTWLTISASDRQDEKKYNIDNSIEKINILVEERIVNGKKYTNRTFERNFFFTYYIVGKTEEPLTDLYPLVVQARYRQMGYWIHVSKLSNIKTRPLAYLKKTF